MSDLKQTAKTDGRMLKIFYHYICESFFSFSKFNNCKFLTSGQIEMFFHSCEYKKQLTFLVVKILSAHSVHNWIRLTNVFFHIFESLKNKRINNIPHKYLIYFAYCGKNSFIKNRFVILKLKIYGNQNYHFSLLSCQI